MLQTRIALRRDAPLAVNSRTERRKPLMATFAREDVAGGFTAIAEACLTTTTRTASAARASPGLARAKQQQLMVLGRDHLNARQRKGGVRRVLVRDSGGEWQRRGVAAEKSGNGDAAFHLSKAKMAIIAAHAAKRARQSDMREFVAATE